MKKIIYFLSIIFIIMQSCTTTNSSNDSDSILLSGKLKKIHFVDSSDNNFWVNFSYNSDGQISRIFYSNESGSFIWQDETFTRNSSGKIINIVFVDYISPQQINYAYTLDNNQNYISCSTTSNPSSVSDDVVTYVYSENRISQIIRSNGYPETQFTYDLNGNIIKVEENNGISWATRQTSSYDEKTNAIENTDFIIASTGSQFGIINFGNNNVLTRNNYFFDTYVNFVFQYSYNNLNKPMSSTFQKTTDNGEITNGTCEYFYY